MDQFTQDRLLLMKKALTNGLPVRIALAFSGEARKQAVVGWKPSMRVPMERIVDPVDFVLVLTRRKTMPMRQRYDESTASLKEVMTADPISPELHAAVQRRKVDARRLAEDAREAAKQRREESL